MWEILENNKTSLERLTNDQADKKIARAEAITEKEREELWATNPEKLRLAEEASRECVSISRRFSQAKTEAARFL